ncbi:hypothetical protein EVAR_91697_1 [Eumeta japonica]|uniref:Uncharacterized protein n=1 Tax=Eumeta variegata TaxID=151549 RepID=A0A4C1ZGM0_EUMVA|nr:hypothetical protein EVAR_91697_1 [Eumeta japonica]
MLRHLEDPSKSKRVPNPGKPLPPRKSEELQPRSIHYRRRSNSTDPVMTPDKRSRDQLSLSSISDPKKHATELKPPHTKLDSLPKISRDAPSEIAVETPKDVEEATNTLVNKIREAQQTASGSLLIQISRRRDLPPNLRVKMQQKRRLPKLWTRTRCPMLKKKLNELARKLTVVVKNRRGTAWERQSNTLAKP